MRTSSLDPPVSEPAKPPPVEADGALAERDVFVADEQTDVTLDRVRYAALAGFTLSAEGVRSEAELSVMFVDESTMADLHERFLGVEEPTDVLAFPMDEELLESGRQPDQGGRGPGAPTEPADPPLLVGDVVVCPTVARRQADERGVSVEEEIELLVVHGVLHLLGHDHVEKAEARRQRRREREILTAFRATRSS